MPRPAPCPRPCRIARGEMLLRCRPESLRAACFDSIDPRIDLINSRIDAIDPGVDLLDPLVDQIIPRIFSIDQRID